MSRAWRLLPWARRRRMPRLIEQLARTDRAAETTLLRLLFDEAGPPALAIDRAGRVVRASAALRPLLGGAACAPGVAAHTVFADDGREDAWRTVARLFEAHAHVPRDFITELNAPQGAVVVSISVVPLADDDGTIGGAILKFTDLTRMHRLEAQLAQSQRLQEVGQLAGGIAHDFNNLLTAVLGAAETIAGRDGLDEETLDDAAQIRSSALRGAALVQQLLAFGRQQTLQPRALAVNEVITDVSRMLRRVLGETIRLELELEAPGRSVRADRTQLDQVLVNLAVNARDAMHDGGTLTLRSGHLLLLEPMSLGADTIPPGRYVVIEVRDTGSGIPPEVLPHIFEPFFTTKRDRGGTGLGLATVHGIVRQSGGYLAAESEPGAGTCMRVYLPRWDDTDETAPKPVQAAPAAAELSRPAIPRAVLLVEDEEPVRRLAERALAKNGWRVLSAESGEAALALLEGDTPDDLVAVVTDMVMPGIDGNALVRAVRKRMDNPGLPAIIVSGYAEATLREGIETVATTFLAKPYSLKDIARTLATVVAQGAAAPR